MEVKVRPKAKAKAEAKAKTKVVGPQLTMVPRSRGAREIIAERGCSMLDRARKICVEKHAGQVDKAGEPYYLHPFAVADMVDGEDAKTVAYLHDVVEDTDATTEWLSAQGFPTSVVDAVDCITRRSGEPYGDYISRVARNRLARTVKMADLRHNLDPSRQGATDAMRARYAKALSLLEGAGCDD